jgi:SnoaL-like domain
VPDVPDEVQDRLDLRSLVEAYAHHADQREYETIATLFTEDGRLTFFEGQPGDGPPIAERVGGAAITDAMRNLDHYSVTTHFLGQQTVVLEGDQATGETYCFAYGVSDADGARSVDVRAIRYLDRYVRQDGRWLIEDRTLVVDWAETRPLG